MNFDFLTNIEWQSIDTWLPLLLGAFLGWLIAFLMDIFYWRSRNNKLKMQNRDLHTRIDTLGGDVERHKKMAISAEKQADAADAQSGRLRNELEGLTTERNRIQSELSTTKNQMAAINTAEPKEVDGLRRRAEQAETRLLALEGDLSAEQERAREAAEQLETAKFQHKQQLEEKRKAAQKTPVAAPVSDIDTRADKDALNKAQERLTATEAELTRLSDENDTLRNQLSEASKSATQSAELTAERDALQQRLQEADDQVAQLKSTVASAAASAPSKMSASVGTAGIGALAGGAVASLAGKAGIGGAGNDDADALMQRLEQTETERITEYNKRVEAEMRVGELENELNEQKLHAQHLEEKIAVLETQPNPDAADGEQSGLQVQLDAANSRIAALQGEVNVLRKREIVPADTATGLTDTVKQHVQMSGDDFLQINGVGHVFARRLHEAGIGSFAQLGALAPAEIERIAQPQSWQIIDASEWIVQAKHLAGGNA